MDRENGRMPTAIHCACHVSEDSDGKVRHKMGRVKGHLKLTPLVLSSLVLLVVEVRTMPLPDQQDGSLSKTVNAMVRNS